MTAYSAFAGGMISVIANAFFAFRLFSDKGSWQPGNLAATVYRGAIGKFLLSIAMFIMVVVLLKPLNVVALFVAYLWVQVSPFFITGILRKA